MASVPRDQTQAARAAALRALAMRPLTAAELRKRLERRFETAAVDEVVRDLLERHLVDDAAYAAAWRGNRERNGPRSAALIHRELLQRGVADDVATAAVDGMDDWAAAAQAARTQLSRLRGLDQQTFTRRLGNYLLRRGFSAGIARRIIESVSAEAVSTGIRTMSAPR